MVDVVQALRRSTIALCASVLCVILGTMAWWQTLSEDDRDYEGAGSWTVALLVMQLVMLGPALIAVVCCVCFLITAINGN